MEQSDPGPNRLTLCLLLSKLNTLVLLFAQETFYSSKEQVGMLCLSQNAAEQGLPSTSRMIWHLLLQPNIRRGRRPPMRLSDLPPVEPTSLVPRSHDPVVLGYPLRLDRRKCIPNPMLLENTLQRRCITQPQSICKPILIRYYPRIWRFVEGFVDRGQLDGGQKGGLLERVLFH